MYVGLPETNQCKSANATVLKEVTVTKKSQYHLLVDKVSLDGKSFYLSSLVLS